MRRHRRKIWGTLLVLLIGYGFYTSRPLREDFRTDLNRRAAAMQSLDREALYRAGSGMEALDDMLTALTPAEAMQHTRMLDGYVFTLFTTTYADPRYGPRRIRTFGMASFLLPGMSTRITHGELQRAQPGP